MLIDKGYYDYDYKFVEKRYKIEDTVMSEDKLNDVMSRFGFGQTKNPAEMSMEQLQAYAMKDINN